MELADNLLTVTNQVLEELGLSDRVTVRGVEPKQDSDRYAIGLAEQTAPTQTAYHHFYLDPVEVLTDNHGAHLTVEELKPYVQREVEKIFPDAASGR